MCIGGKIGAKIKLPKSTINSHEYLFGEDQSRYIIEISEKNKKNVMKMLEENSVYYDSIGKTHGDTLDLGKELNIKIDELEKLNSSWFKRYFNEN